MLRENVIDYVRCPNCSYVYEATEDRCPQCQQITIINEAVLQQQVFNLND